ncbi:MAG: hypothetical protein FWD78_15570 [Treponema sp.]|nr:hypothetical protein [Treponema sp.]
MQILINGKPADIVLEAEKTIKDLLAGLEKWLEGSGGRLSGLCIDGVETTTGGLQQAFELKLENINSIDIRVSTLDELEAQALAELIKYCGLYADSSFEERQQVRKDWEDSAAYRFLSAEIKDIFKMSCLTFAGEGIPAAELGFAANERLRELADPAAEINAMEKLAAETVKRMIDLPLDVQTGKDGRAAETVRIFSDISEKIMRLLKIQDQRGADLESLKIEDLPVKKFLDSFGDALKELTEAYRNQDTVLIGDLAEYELAPMLTKLYSGVKEFILNRAGQ